MSLTHATNFTIWQTRCFKLSCLQMPRFQTGDLSAVASAHSVSSRSVLLSDCLNFLRVLLSENIFIAIWARCFFKILLYSKTSKMTNLGTCHLQKIIIFKLILKPSFARSFGHLGLFARSNSLNANRHLASFVTFEVVICEVLLYYERRNEWTDVTVCRIDGESHGV